MRKDWESPHSAPERFIAGKDQIVGVASVVSAESAGQAGQTRVQTVGA